MLYTTVDKLEHLDIGYCSPTEWDRVRKESRRGRISFLDLVELLHLNKALRCTRAEPQFKYVWTLFGIRCINAVRHHIYDSDSVDALYLIEKYAAEGLSEESLQVAANRASLSLSRLPDDAHPETLVTKAILALTQGDLCKVAEYTRFAVTGKGGDPVTETYVWQREEFCNILQQAQEELPSVPQEIEFRNALSPLDTDAAVGSNISTGTDKEWVPSYRVCGRRIPGWAAFLFVIFINVASINLMENMSAAWCPHFPIFVYLLGVVGFSLITEALLCYVTA